MRPREYIENLTPKRLLLLAAAFSVAALLAALTAQYGFSLHPCHLCVLQRYPYAAIACIALLTAWRGSPKIQVMAAFLCAGLLFLDAGIALYHTGVEYHWFPGPSGCTSTSTGGETIEELRAQIMNAPAVTCDQAMAYIFGLSMAAWNFLAALVAHVVTLYAALQLWKKT
jgi:disulfide bond formation protein DsbB